MPIEQRTPTDRTLTGKQRLPQVMHDHVFGAGSILPMEESGFLARLFGRR